MKITNSKIEIRPNDYEPKLVLEIEMPLYTPLDLGMDMYVTQQMSRQPIQIFDVIKEYKAILAEELYKELCRTNPKYFK